MCMYWRPTIWHHTTPPATHCFQHQPIRYLGWFTNTHTFKRRRQPRPAGWVGFTLWLTHMRLSWHIYMCTEYTLPTELKVDLIVWIFAFLGDTLECLSTTAGYSVQCTQKLISWCFSMKRIFLHYVWCIHRKERSMENYLAYKRMIKFYSIFQAK